MKVAALDDARTIVPNGFRAHLLRHLQHLLFAGQGRRCPSERYSDAYFLKYRHGLIMYLAVDDETIGAIGVEYNYGQSV